MNYKDLAHRCIIDIKQHEKGDNRVFYFKPDSFLLDDPEKQRAYREKLLKKITAVPPPEPITYMGDELHRQILETIQDKSQPTICKKMLADYYKRRQYTLQHKKYKVLLRWAHHALTCEYMERVGHEATFKYGKIEYDMENSMQRHERLNGEDDFDTAMTWARPNTKAKEGGSLYVEKQDIVYFNWLLISNLESSNLKWIPLQKRFEIFQDAVEEYNQLRIDSLSQLEVQQAKIRERGEDIYKEMPDMQDELNQIHDESFYSKYLHRNTGRAEKIMNSQNSDYEQAPFMIDNSIQLKLSIIDKSQNFGIYGDIELDQGFSFAYQITIFFPTEFHKQIIKSQFSLYDAFAGEQLDPNAIQKRNLSQMNKIDTNIFRDISTTKNNIPTQESLSYDNSFSDIKVVRIKGVTWLDYVIIQPTIPLYLQKQEAFLSTNNPIDSLLRSAINFLDVNDLATVNRILEETARVHSQNQKQKFQTQLAKQKKKSISKIEKQPIQQANIKEKAKMKDEPGNIKDHFSNALKGEIIDEQLDSQKDNLSVNTHSVRYLPQHLIHGYYILRHLEGRDSKQKLLYCLNYFRSIQKRLMIDLREFGTRERVLGDQSQPLIPPEEGDKITQQNTYATIFKRPNADSEKVIGSELRDNFSSEMEGDKNLFVFDETYLKKEQNLVDMKKFKFKGKFNNKIYSTCPSIPRFHATFGEPVEHQPLNVEMERVGQIKHVNDESVRLLGRIDKIEIDEKTKEVFIKDDFGIYIMYECSLQDMKDLEEELLKVGSYYIQKHEYLVNTENEKPYPLIDRLTLIEDLLEQELEFHFNKVQLVQSYLECYEHISDPLEQQRIIQIIIDLMALRPRLNLTSTYFKDSYRAEIKCLIMHQELVRELISTQMRIEKAENKRMQAYLDLSYKITEEQSKGKWHYNDAEGFFNELRKRRALLLNEHDLSYVQNQIIEENEKKDQDNKKDSTEKNKEEEEQGKTFSPTRRFLNKIQNRNYGSKYSQAALQGVENDENDFAKVLGLPPITIESLYSQYKEKDDIIIEIMNEYSNYVRVYEGYPDFMIDKGITNIGNRSNLQKTSKLESVQMNSQSIPINFLDFYDSLNFINKLYSTLKCSFNELVDVLKPHDNTLMTLIELKLLEQAKDLFIDTKSHCEGITLEYQGIEYLEDETIVGNSDKISFYAKDMVSQLMKSQKENINPFIIGKLDLETLNYFEFPYMPKDENPFLREIPYLEQNFEILTKQALEKSQKVKIERDLNLLRFQSQLQEYMRKINIPSMLTLQCNVVELLRLRQELICAISETIYLTEIYDKQCKLANRQNFKTTFNDVINFDNHLIDNTRTNFIDEGPGNFITLELPINEFDPLLKSNINFRNPDAFKMLICSSGLEEVRAILHYQLMQKQLLIIGVRQNQLLIDQHQRALAELEFVRKGYSLPNMVIKLQNMISKQGDGFNPEGYSREKQKFTANLSSEAANHFYIITGRKSKLRNTISKKFSNYLTSVTTTFAKVEVSLRILRAYKIKLLHSYCKEVLKEAYFDAMRIQTIHTCQKLRTLANYFSYEDTSITSSSTKAQSQQELSKSNLFRFEQTEYLENIFASYNPQYLLETSHGYQQKEVLGFEKIINSETYEILDFYTIPSTITLCKLETIQNEELSQINIKHPTFNFKSQVDENDVEHSIKEMILRCTEIYPEYPKDDSDREKIGLRVNDFQESYDYSQTGYSQVLTYYSLIERILRLEYFIHKQGSISIDSLQLEFSVQTGLPFWKIDYNEELSIATKFEQNQQLAEQILNKMVADKRAKINLADDLTNLQNQIQAILKRLVQMKQKSEQTQVISTPKILEYIISHQEYKFNFLIYLFEKLIDNYYEKKAAKEVKCLFESHQQLVKRDHIRMSYKHNSFHVNLSSIRSDMYSIEPSNFHSFYSNNQERADLENCIQPIINEQALNPPQITILQGMYTQQKFRTTQYAGQVFSKVYQPLETGLINISEHERQYANSTALSIKSFVKDFLVVIHKEQVNQDDETLPLDQLKKCKKILGDLIQARSIKQALICWFANSTIPLDPEVYQSYQQLYKNEIFWKIINYKDQLPSLGGISQQQNRKEKPNEQSKKLELIEHLQQQVLIDQVQTCKAEISVLSSEFERQIVKAAISTIENESSALANCFQMSSKIIEMHIHPFQQFASTLYPTVDKNSHLDMVTKLGEVQKFISKLRNRGTEVETLTSGPGMVFTVKDLNECIQLLSRGLIKYGEQELRSRCEDQAKKEIHYQQLIYVKDRRISNLEQRIENTRDNLDKLINSKMYEKGNQLIYELDCVNRQLRLFKDNVFQMERELRAKIRAEFINSLQISKHQVETTEKLFKVYQDDLEKKVDAVVASEQARIEKELKRKAEEYKNLGQSPTRINLRRAVGSTSFVYTGGSPRREFQEEINQRASPLPKLEIITSQPSQFYSNALAEINQLSEEEARSELALLSEKMRKLRLLWKTKEVLMVEKYEREIFTMKKQLTSNACLWEQLAEAEKREKVLKQELVFTQQSLAASEKVIEKLKDDLKKSESDRIRLNQYKTNKQQRLEELESKVRKFEVLDNINLEKLIDTLGNKEKELQKLKDVEKNFSSRIEIVEKKKDLEVKEIKYQYLKEQNLKRDVLDRLESLRMELRMLEKNEGSMADVWKSKCKELVEICNKLKVENESIRDKMNQILSNDQGEFQQSRFSQGNVQLPKLMSNTQNAKMSNNIVASKYGSVGPTMSRQTSNYKHDLERSFVANLQGSNNDLSTTFYSGSKQQSAHPRGKSLYDPNNFQTSRMKETSVAISSGSQNITGAIIQSSNKKAPHLGIYGQQNMLKGFQSVRASQGEALNNQSSMIHIGKNKNNTELNQELLIMSQTSTNITKGLIKTDQNTQRLNLNEVEEEERKTEITMGGIGSQQRDQNSGNFKKLAPQSMENSPVKTKQFNIEIKKTDKKGQQSNIKDKKTGESAVSSISGFRGTSQLS